MTTTASNGMAAFESPSAFKKSPSIRRFWSSSVFTRVNGWGLVQTEMHRVSAIKGDALIHFAPSGSDFDNPVVLTTEQKAAALQFAQDWCRKNLTSVTKDYVLESIQDEIKQSVRAVATLRKNVLEAKCLDDKILANGKMKDQQATLTNQRLKIFAAEDAVDDCIRTGAIKEFDSLAKLFPKVALLIEQLLKKQPAVATAN